MLGWMVSLAVPPIETEEINADKQIVPVCTCWTGADWMHPGAHGAGAVRSVRRC